MVLSTQARKKWAEIQHKSTSSKIHILNDILCCLHSFHTWPLGHNTSKSKHMVSGGYNSWAFIFFFYNTCSAISNISSGSRIMCSINITWEICKKCRFHHLTTLGETAIKKLSRMKHLIDTMKQWESLLWMLMAAPFLCG